jgi:hypothetical protein
MTTRLTLSFRNTADRISSFSVDEPRSDLTEEAVETVMTNMISENIFNTTGGDLVDIASARITTTTVQQLI